MSLFKGIVVLNKNKYETLKTNGFLINNEETISYDPDTTLYVDSLFLQNITKTSELENDNGYITQNDIVKFKVQVGQLPTEGVEKTIYFVPQDGTDNHIEYMWIDGRFERIGTTQIDLTQYALKSEIPTTLPANDVYSWAKEPTKPTYTADEVGAIPSSSTNIVKTDIENQTINGATIFNKSIQIGGSSNSNETGIKITRRCINDNNNIHEGLLKVDNNGVIKISHKSNSINSANEDAYIAFNQDKLVYAKNNAGNNATEEKEIALKEDIPTFSFDGTTLTITTKQEIISIKIKESN